VMCPCVRFRDLKNKEAMAHWGLSRQNKHRKRNFDVFLNVHLSIFISVFNQIDAQNLFHNKFYFMPPHVSSTCAQHQEVKIALDGLWYHHNYRCDDTRSARSMQRHEIKLTVKQIL